MISISITDAEKLKDEYPHLYFLITSKIDEVKPLKEIEGILKKHRCSEVVEACPMHSPG